MKLHAVALTLSVLTASKALPLYFRRSQNQFLSACYWVHRVCGSFNGISCWAKWVFHCSFGHTVRRLLSRLLPQLIQCCFQCHFSLFLFKLTTKLW